MLLLPSDARRRPRALIAATAVCAAALVVVVLAAAGAFSGGGSSTVGHVRLNLTARKAPAGRTQMDPFGSASNKPNYRVPPPPGEAGLVTTTGTKTTQLWVHRNSVPASTIAALERRHGRARIYLFGGPQQISGRVADQLSRYGTVMRVPNDDNVAFSAGPKDTAVDTAIAL